MEGEIGRDRYGGRGIALPLLCSQTVEEKQVPFLKLKLDSIGAQVKVRSFDIVVDSYLGGIYLQHQLFKGKST